MKKGKEPFDVILLAIMFDPAEKKILIGRREGDKDVPKLTWGFPEGRLRHGDNVDKVLKNRVKEKTGYDIKNLGSVFSKVFPEKKDLFAVYFLCEVIGGKGKPMNDFLDLKWVKAKELSKYFKTSFHPILKEYLTNLA